MSKSYTIKLIDGQTLRTKSYGHDGVFVNITDDKGVVYHIPLTSVFYIKENKDG